MNKKEIFQLALLGLCSFTSLASANCSTGINGTFENKKGDRFQIVMNCNQLKVTDLQLNDHYEATTDGFALQNQPSRTPHLLGSLGSFFPISVSLARSERDDFRDVYLRFKLPIKRTDLSEGYTPPVIEAKFVVYVSNNQIVAGLDSVRAVPETRSSPLQQALIKGLNMGLEILNRFFRTTNSFETLTRTN